MAIYSVQSGPVEHNGALYEEGAILDLNAEQATLLIEQGIIVAEQRKRNQEKAG